MPMIDVTYAAGSLREEQLQQIPERFAPILAKWEGLPGNARLIANIWVLLHELKASTLTAGGKASTLDQPLYRIVVTIPKGALDEPRKKGLIDELTRSLLEIDGHPVEGVQGPLRVYFLINEVPYEDWGYDGRTLTREQVLAFILNTIV